MPVSVEKRDGKWCVVGPTGKLEGKCHASKQAAVKQVQAINLSKRRQEGKPAPPAPKSKALKILAQEKFAELAKQIQQAKGLDTEMGAAPIMIMSDGTVEGTHLMLHGQPVLVDSLNFSCSRGEYGYCDMSITQRSEENGMERTMTLRKHTEAEENPDN